MPKVTLSQENKVSQYTEYPKLSLEHGERALIMLIEPEPTVEYKHVLRAPEIGPDGRVLMEERKTQKGDSYEAPVTEFIGQHLCFGDFETVERDGVDPEGCPTCRAAVEEEGIDKPTAHYAMHVIQYSLKPNGWVPRDPFAVELKAWTFSGTRLNQIIDLATDWDLSEHDLKLGPCENKKFQKYDINVSSNAQWKADESRIEVVKATYKNNRAEDLSTLIARRITKTDALSDIQKVVERIAQVNGRGTAPAAEPTAEPQVDTNTGEVTSDADAASKSNLKSMDLSDIMKDL